jgi:Putative Holin-like Toxin (Hol-Tox)
VAVALPVRREVTLMLTVFEGISLMIGFGTLIVAVIAVVISSSKKK